MNQLYESYDPYQRHPIVFEKGFQAGSVHICLRPFFIPNDFQLYNEWMNRQIAVGNEPMEGDAVFSEGYFEALLTSSSAQSLCGLIGGEPAFQVDLFTSLYYPDESINGIDLGQGDVIMQIIMAPQVLANQQLGGHVLSACMDYLAGFPELKRVFWAIGTDYQYYNKVIKKAGLRYWPLAGNGKQVCGYALTSNT